jgi:hypothetical protein
MQFEGEDMQYLAPRSWPAVTEQFFQCLRDRVESIVVVGHNVPFDMAGVNGWLMRYGAPSLPPMRVSDTYRHTYKHGSMYSKSLANTARMLQIPFPKGHVERWQWDEATLWDDPDALRAIQEYNENDVRLLFPIRERLIELGHLKVPYTLWTP